MREDTARHASEFGVRKSVAGLRRSAFKSAGFATAMTIVATTLAWAPWAAGLRAHAALVAVAAALAGLGAACAMFLLIPLIAVRRDGWARLYKAVRETEDKQ